jgi:predicted dienelactone hydrolase
MARETGTTRPLCWVGRLPCTLRPLSNRRLCFSGFLASLLLIIPGAGWPPARAAEELVVRFDGLSVPLDLAELEAWSEDPHRQNGHLSVWLHLLDPLARQGLVRLLKAPLLQDRSFGMELLQSWTGTQMLQEVGRLLRGPDERSMAPLLRETLQELFTQQSTVSTLQLLRALPAERLTLRVDALLALAEHWRDQLKYHSHSIAKLRSLSLPQRQSRPLRTTTQLSTPQRPKRLMLPVAHRSAPLPVEIWPAAAATRQATWVLLMPGLGGSSSHLHWLAAALAERGWPVVLLEHPGSDEEAVRASLAGEAPPPGAESLPLRLADVQAVLVARSQGQFPAMGADPASDQGIVLIGHSLGGLAALMAAGMVPEVGLSQRCHQALTSLPLTNLSRLLQCQLTAVTGDGADPQRAAMVPRPDQTPLRGVVTYNGFGSLLWPERGLADLPLPVLMVGGTLDLITPPVQEQLALLASSHHPRSRLVLVDGGSHFSPVRMQPEGEALFQLGEDLVGANPQLVQGLLLQITLEFLEASRHPTLLSPQRRQHGEVEAYVLDPQRAQVLQRSLPPAPVSPRSS